MMKVLLTTFFCIGSLTLIAQDYSYSFGGKISEEQQQKIIASISSIPGVESCKIKYKTDSERGEFLIYEKQINERSEDQSLFTPSSIKNILIESNLQPLDFRSIK